MPSRLIALDADGVLLDYGAAYAGAWAQTFGAHPVLRNADAYWPIDRWDVGRLRGKELERFRASFDEQFWSGIPPIVGALEACNELVGQGYELICVTAVASQFRLARLANLRTFGFPLSDVIVVDDQASLHSPKAEVIRTLNPVAFVDDYLPYHRGLPGHVHKALITRESYGSPNVGPELSIVDSQHKNLKEFARSWVMQATYEDGSTDEDSGRLRFAP